MEGCTDMTDPDMMTDMGWSIEYYQYQYIADEDKTIYFYYVSVSSASVEAIIEFRLQMPCDCLLDECMLDELILSSEPSNYVKTENGHVVWNMLLKVGQSVMATITLKGYVPPSSDGQLAAYGADGSCIYGGAIVVPQPCLCWSDFDEDADCDVDWYV